MLDALKNLAKRSLFVQRTYRRYLQPHRPQFEPETYILRGMRFDQAVDIGAHAGTYSILLSPRSNRVYAFEPSNHSFRILQSLGLPNVTAYNLALGDKPGSAAISLPQVRGRIDHALATLRPLGADDYEDVRTEKVRVAKFDDFEAEIDFARIDFVKIDVEGFEMNVLRGMSRLIETRKPALLIEIEQRHNPNYTDVFNYLAGLSYEAYVTEDGISLVRIDKSQVPKVQSTERFSKDEARKSKIGEPRYYLNNFFFLRSEHKPKFHIPG